MKFCSFVFLFVFFIFTVSCGEKQGRINPEYINGKPVFKSGDIIGHYSNADFLGFFRNIAKADFNHVGIIMEHDGRLMVLEATGGGVGFNELEDFYARGNYKYTVLRVKSEYEDSLPGVISQAMNYVGYEYDNSFDLSDEKIYCSELVYKAFEKGGGIEPGRLQKVKEVIGVHKYNPILKGIAGNFVKNVSMEQEVIMPESIMKSVKFNIVYP